jgi:tetratricopeptide (TPR) repeat protein
MHLTMGALCNETNDAQGCLEHNILCLALRKAQADKENRPDVPLAFAHSQMGIAYMMVKKFALATEYFKQCIEMLKSLDADVDDFGFPVCNLGLAYWIQGELDLADTTLTDLLLQREKAYGKLDRVSYKYAHHFYFVSSGIAASVPLLLKLLLFMTAGKVEILYNIRRHIANKIRYLPT